MTDNWSAVPELVRCGRSLPSQWAEMFGPLQKGRVDDLMIVGQTGQSIDGRIATASGDSKYINGEPGLDHLHRLRALVDAVVVGVGTAVTDNPQLTVRRVSGPSPVRVVIDPTGRLPASAKMLASDGTRRIVFAGKDAPCRFPADVEVVRVELTNGRAEPRAIVAGLAALGLKRILIEGGAQTLSAFLMAGCLDRLHIVVAPMLMGTGHPSLRLPDIEKADEAMRPPVRAHLLGDEVLFDIDLSAQRVSIGRANTST